jgi:hypothetical protein
MIEGIKCCDVDNYLQDYWRKRIIIDQSKIISNNQDTAKTTPTNNSKIDLDHLNNDIDQLINEHNKKMSQHINNKVVINHSSDTIIDQNDIIDENDVIEYKEKLNNNHKTSLRNNNNVVRKKYHDFGNPIDDRSDNKRAHTISCIRSGSNRKKDSDFGMYDKQESCKHRNIQKNFDTCQNKREVYTLPKKCRLHEYGLRERKVLLDSFSKPKLIK